jgi:Na+/H+ antiporter NhaD/arsenite permease-like protein
VRELIAVAAFVAAYALIATERVNRVVAALAGAGLVVAFGVVGSEDAFYSPETGIDWDVIFLLFGMMVIVGVVKQTGLFEYLAIWAAKRARAQPFRVMVLLVVLTAVASTALPNVTTMLLVVPVTFLVCERLGVTPVPFIIAEALASNIGGTATLIGDPPNIIIASRAGLTFVDFLVHLAPIVLLVLLAFIGLCRVMFRGAFRYDPSRTSGVLELDEREAIRDVPLLVRSMVVLAAVLLGFVFGRQLELEPSLVALIGAGVLVLASRLEPNRYVEEVEWETLLFFLGLFVMIGALVKAGVIDEVAKVAVEMTGGRLLFATMLLLVVSAMLSALIDNIPYVAAMTPLVTQLIEAAPDANQATVLWWALALGADLGGNATAVGAGANVVAIGLAGRSGHPISFWEFTKYGAVVAAVSVAMCVPYLYLRYFVV